MAISALQHEGISDLLNAVQQQLFELYATLDVLLPYSEGKLISLFHSQGDVELVEHTHQGVHIRGRLPGRYVAQFQAFVPQPAGEDIQELEI